MIARCITCDGAMIWHPRCISIGEIGEFRCLMCGRQMDEVRRDPLDSPDVKHCKLCGDAFLDETKNNSKAFCTGWHARLYRKLQEEK